MGMGMEAGMHKSEGGHATSISVHGVLHELTLALAYSRRGLHA